MRWTLKPQPESDQIQLLMEVLQVDSITATLLAQRGITTFDQARAFFRPELADLHDPFLMKDMRRAVDRIERAIQQDEHILVFGDYDVDGTTAVSLVTSYLRSFYPKVSTYIPDRYDEGYGISFKGIDFADDNECSLIIALDCGIKSVDHVAYAKERNIDFIICDHHRPGDRLPEAVAILNPKQEDCSYPYDELCGCGIGFKLIQALGQGRNQDAGDLIFYLDLVATAIGADIVPITGENRVMAYYGLQVLNSHPRPGIWALTKQLKKKEITIHEVVFVIAPRINAAGRIKHGNHAVALLTEYDLEQAEEFAAAIEKYNTDRKTLDQEMTKMALRQIEENKEQERFTTVVFQEDWHKGVIGIVASRLTEVYYRPTIVFTRSGEKYAASARSVQGFDVYNALEACAEHLEQFGGHMYAAGMTLKPENYQNFKKAFEAEVQRSIDPELLSQEIQIDAVINLSDITPKMFRILKQFEPFGPSNRTPVFLTKGLTDTGYAKAIGSDQTHLKLTVKQEGSAAFSAVGFDLADKLDRVREGSPFEAVYSIDENEWNGNVSLQLRIKDIR